MDWGPVVIGVVATGGTIWAATTATRGKVAEVAATAQVALAATAQKADEVKIKADDEFQTRILAELQRIQDKYEALGEKHNQLAIEHAELRGEVKTLIQQRAALATEVTSLKDQLARVRADKDALDFENQTQAQEIARLNGRIAELTTQLAAVTQAAANVAAGGTTP